MKTQWQAAKQLINEKSVTAPLFTADHCVTCHCNLLSQSFPSTCKVYAFIVVDGCTLV